MSTSGLLAILPTVLKLFQFCTKSQKTKVKQTTNGDNTNCTKPLYCKLITIQQRSNLIDNTNFISAEICPQDF